MELKDYDGRRVRITTPDGEVYEGVCRYNGREFNECEFGFDEDSLQTAYLTFFARDIGKIELLPDGGPYGGYTGRFGLLEESAVNDGADGIEEVLLSEENEQIYRLLLCIENRIDRRGSEGLPPPDELAKLLDGTPPVGDPRTAEKLQEIKKRLMI